MSNKTFVSGLDLNERFFFEVVQPILHKHYPQLAYAAARMGSGSEVLGFDTVMSTDHDWGPYFQLFLRPEDHAALGEAITKTLSHELPFSFMGYSTHYAPPNEEGTSLLEEKVAGPVNHRILVTTVRQFCWQQMAYDVAKPMGVTDWLTISQQILLEMTAGRVFVDDVGELTVVRQSLAYFPHDVWLYLMNAQWSRIGEEEPFVGRTGLVGDELGSRLIATRLVHDIMLLCFLQERRYAPYPKWFGSAFRQLDCGEVMGPLLTAVLEAPDWHSREAALCVAYQHVAEQHNALGVTAPLSTETQWFHDRPFRIIDAGRFCAALNARIQDETVRAIKTGAGSIDQFSHSTPLRSYPHLRNSLHGLYL